MSMLRTAEIDMANSVAPSDIDAFLPNAAWAIRSTYHTVLKASPGAAIFGRDMLFDIPFLADWNKIGAIGNIKLILTQNEKTNPVSIMITKLVIKYWCAKMVSSAKQRAVTTVIHGQSQRFIQMEQSGFNGEVNLKD
jgi:hypothetical protein